MFITSWTVIFTGGEWQDWICTFQGLVWVNFFIVIQTHLLVDIKIFIVTNEGIIDTNFHSTFIHRTSEDRIHKLGILQGGTTSVELAFVMEWENTLSLSWSKAG